MLEKTVDFDDSNSYEDFGIVFESLVIGKAEPRLMMVDVPFRNGSLDATNYFGDVRYKDRTITMGFLIPWWSDDQYGIFADVQNQLNGQRKRITFSADEDWYYSGRLTVGDFKIDNGFFKFEITAVCDPYKYQDTVVSKTTTALGTEINLQNDYMKTVPTITTDASIELQFKNNTYNFTAGTYKRADIVLTKGVNVMTITGAANVVISYRQGRL